MTKRYSLQRRRSHLGRPSRDGAVTVELALTISMAFFFFFAALEFSRVAMLRHTVEHALYEGARRGVVPGATSEDVTTEVQKVLRTVGVRKSEIAVNPTTIQLATPDIEVSVTVPLEGNLYLPPVFFRDRTIERTIRMQRETQANNR